MMKNKHLLSGIPVVLLAFFLVFTACENGTTEVDGTVGISSQEAPVVTATAVKGGVLLQWNPILDGTYNVWRKAGEAQAIQLSWSSGYNVYQDKETGKIRYLDLVSDTNTLTANTEYTYTVVASGSYKTTSKTEVKATPTDIPAKGTTKLDPVSAVTLTLLPDADAISVSWTAGTVPSLYSVSVYRDGTDQVGSTISTSLGETKASISNWTSQTEGEYTAFVYAYVSGTYFKNSDYAVSAKQKYEALFGSGSLSTGSSSVQPIAANGTLTGFSVPIYLSSAKPGVTYAVERATVGAAGNAGTYAPVTVYTDASATTALTTTDLTADVVGTLRTTVYDKLPASAGKYKYRVKATKGTVTPQTKEISSTVSVNPYEYASGSLSIAAATTDADTGAKTYAVTPSLTYKGILQAGDKLVIYYVKGTSSSVYQTGPYTSGVEFTKAELEADPVVAKNLVIPKAIGDSYAYVKAYVVLADGSQQNVTSYISSGGGVSSVNNWASPPYATLNY